MIQVAYAIVWWLILVVIGLITFPSYPGVWRGSWDEVLGRDMDVDNIYKSPDNDKALALLRKYNIEYIYVGKLEKEKYPAESLQKFSSDSGRYKPIYEKDGVTIYQVMP